MPPSRGAEHQVDRLAQRVDRVHDLVASLRGKALERAEPRIAPTLQAMEALGLVSADPGLLR